MTLKGKALLLSYFTVSYCLIEGVISIGARIFARSGALIGFGVDSFIESLSGSVMVWRFSKDELSKKREDRVEKRALKLVAITFFILGLYVFIESSKSLIQNEAPDRSLLGMIITVFALVIMSTLAFLKYKTGNQLNSKSLIADGKQSFVCMLLSAVTLSGLGINYFFGIWQADPIAGLLITLYLWKEDLEVYKGDVDKF